MDCYNCGIILNRKTRSAEHILPNSIGGKRKAYNLLCKTCNEMFGRTIDNALASKLTRFYTLLTSADTTPSHSPSSVKKKDGNTASHNRFLVSVKNNRSFSGNEAYFRSIAKICLNYYLTKGYSREYCKAVKTFIRGENQERIHYYYAPENEIIHPLAENEVSHILHLHGNKEAGILYAYIELFNMQNLIVIFTMDYDGEDIDVTYCRDVITNEEMPKKIELGLTRHQLERLSETSQTMEGRLFPRFERLLQIIHKH